MGANGTVPGLLVSWHHIRDIKNINDNDNELFIQTKSNEEHHKGNINNTYKNINITTFVPRRLHLKTSWPLACNRQVPQNFNTIVWFQL